VLAIADLESSAYREGQVQVEVRVGEVLPGLLAAIRQHRADLAIVGTHGRHGLERILGGSVAETLVRSAECSVLVARSRTPAARKQDRELAVQAVLPGHEHAWAETPWGATEVSVLPTRS
jgi:hypothetical protein